MSHNRGRGSRGSRPGRGRGRGGIHMTDYQQLRRTFNADPENTFNTATPTPRAPGRPPGSNAPTAASAHAPREPTARPTMVQPPQPMTQPVWARAPTLQPIINDWNDMGNIRQPIDDDPAYTALLNEMGIPQNEREAMREPSVKHIVRMLARPQPPAREAKEVSTSKTRELSEPQDNHERPTKRMCPASREDTHDSGEEDFISLGDNASVHEYETGITHIKFPRPPAADSRICQYHAILPTIVEK
ncbi:hypothetical protein HYPSUDRAFT_59184 [Hypholoma sublateritium FD-334 SS-4]|uniref:Uncharacterized protein n=1 Tax=Hypholoma sublateritium (strain FD-334 SS-4) TaxID=945553 RepID=A0A0D2N6S3_HYPSF|nr:hypothetical protein HYPSUDRAFT_59184 [Hypholoma sublateritium FD-334 SS-4]